MTERTTGTMRPKNTAQVPQRSKNRSAIATSSCEMSTHRPYLRMKGWPPIFAT